MSNNSFEALMAAKYREGDYDSGNKLYSNYCFLINVVVQETYTPSSKYKPFIYQEIGKRTLWAAIKSYLSSNGNFRVYAKNKIKDKITNFIVTNPEPLLDPSDLDSIKKLINVFGLDVESDNYKLFIYALEVLPPKVKKCVGLYYLEGKNVYEVSEVLGTNAETVNNTLNLVREKLHKEFDPLVKLSCYPITYYYPNYTLDEIKEAISLLDKESIERVYNAFGKDLARSHKDFAYNYKQLNKLLISKLNIVRKGSISNKEESNGEELIAPTSKPQDIVGKRLKTIMDYFPNYSIDQIKDAISHLSEGDQEKIHFIFGPDLDATGRLSANKYYNHFINKLKNDIQMILEGKDLSIEKERTKPLTSYFKGYSLEEVKDAVFKLPAEDQVIIYNIFGNELIAKGQITKHPLYGKFLYNIKVKIDKLLNGKELGKKQKKTILDYFIGYSMDDIKNAVDKLSDKKKAIVYSIFGENLTNRDYFSKYPNYNSFVILVKKDILSILEGKEIKKDGTIKSITDYFEGYTLDQIKEVVSKLPLKYIGYVYDVFGPDLSPQKNISKRPHYIEFSNTVRMVILKGLSGEEIIDKTRKKKEKIDDFFPNYTHENIVNAVKLLPVDEQNNLYKVFGEELNIFDKSNKDEYDFFLNHTKHALKMQLNTIYKRKKSKITTSKPIESNTDIKTLNVDTTNIAEFIKGELLKNTTFTKDELMIFVLRISLIDKNDLTIEELANYYGISPDEVNNITSRVLMSVGERFISLYNMILRDLYPMKKANEKDL